MSLKPVVLDISHHNDVVSWSAIRNAGIFGVIHKATQGVGMVDKTYAKRRADAEAAGLRFGAYHFADSSDPRAQADHFLETAKPDKDTLLALDWENNGSRMMTVAQAKAFLERVMQVTGRPPSGVVIYGGNVLKEQITSKEDCEFFGRFPLWLCQYGPKAKLPKAWKSYWLWQYSETGKIDGIAHDGRVDLNVHGGTDLAAEWAVTAVPAPKEEPPVVVAKKVTTKDLAKVSRKAAWIRNARNTVVTTGTGGVLAAIALAKQVTSDIGEVIGNHWIAILVSLCVLALMFFLYIEGLMKEDVKENRAKPSGETA